MRILSPVDSPREVDVLIEAGADEFYGGYLPPFWEEKYGSIASLNRRSYREANVPSWEEFDSLLEECWKRGIPFYLTLNAPLIPEEEDGEILDFARRCVDMGVSGFIVSDPGLLIALREAGVKAEIHASTLFNAFSSATVKFLERFGVSRVILPRELTLGEIEGLAKKSGRVKLESIVLRGKCPNIEGLCGHLHDDPNRCWPCEMKYSRSWEGRFDSRLVREAFLALSEWEELDRYYSCGLCAIPFLAKAGVFAVKIVGRGSETEKKMRAVRMVKKMWELTRGEMDRERCVGMGRSIYAEEFGFPCQAKNCYFPEFFQEEAGE